MQQKRYHIYRCFFYLQKYRKPLGGAQKHYIMVKSKTWCSRYLIKSHSRRSRTSRRHHFFHENSVWNYMEWNLAHLYGAAFKEILAGTEFQCYWHLPDRIFVGCQQVGALDTRVIFNFSENFIYQSPVEQWGLPQSRWLRRVRLLQLRLLRVHL